LCVGYHRTEGEKLPQAILTRLIDVFRASEKLLRRANPEYVVFTCRFSTAEEPIKLGVPFRSLGEQIEQGMSSAELYRDMPRGSKRAGWKKDFLEALFEVAKDIGDISEEEIERDSQLSCRKAHCRVYRCC
jgi:hypothetical protein